MNRKQIVGAAFILACLFPQRAFADGEEAETLNDPCVDEHTPRWSNRWANCVAMLNEPEDARIRAERRAEIAATLPPKTRTELKRLEKTADAYFEERSRKTSSDCDGQSWYALMVHERKTLEAGLLAALKNARAGTLPPEATEAEFAEADAALNAIYTRVMGLSLSDRCAPARERIRAEQRTWLAYREAWVRLGRKLRPEVPANAWRTWLTRERTDVLADVASTWSDE